MTLNGPHAVFSDFSFMNSRRKRVSFPLQCRDVNLDYLSSYLRAGNLRMKLTKQKSRVRVRKERKVES